MHRITLNFLPILLACAPIPSEPDASTPCTDWSATELATHLDVPGLLEASGLVMSGRHADVFWTHNDSGGAAELFAVGVDGVHRGTWTVDGVSTNDWEDLGQGPCWPGASKSCLYIGDVGDNSGAKEAVHLHVVEEPETLQIALDQRLTLVRTRRFTYDDGPHDVEALFVDPATTDVYLVQKRPFDDADRLLRRVHRLSTTTEEANPVAVRVAEFHAPASDDGLFTGGAIRPDGLAIALRTYGNGYEYRRSSTDPIAAFFASTPVVIPPVRLGEGETELQGEAITYARDGRALFTTSEGAKPPLNVRRCAP